MIKGIDTSKWQASKVDYVEAKKAGYQFVFLRIGYNKTKDKCFEADYASAVKAGLKVGVYFYTLSTTEAQAVADATRVLGWLNNRHLDLPVAFDLEDAKQKSKSRKEVNSAMYNAFAGKIKPKYDCMLYTGEYYFNNYIEKSAISDKVWIAKYSVNRPSVDRDIHFWQYTSSAYSTDFYKAKLDRNYMLIDVLEDEKNSQRDNIVATAKAWIGRNEADGSHKEIIDVYNNHKPLARSYAVKYTDSWCATFVSAVAIKAGCTDIIPTECSCQKMIDLFKKIGCWCEDDAHVPHIGDIIFYDWQDSGAGDNTGWSDHVGIVIEVSQNQIKVIEGNYDNAVKIRTIAVNGKTIRGYGLPSYSDEKISNPYAVPTKSLKRTYPMTKGNDVKWVQWELFQRGYLAEKEIDGAFGNDTKNAVISYQKHHGLQPDGIVGPATRYAMLND